MNRAISRSIVALLDTVLTLRCVHQCTSGKQEKEHAALVASVDKLRSKFTNCVNEDEREV